MDIKRRRFRKLDKNKDNHLDVEELASGFKSGIEKNAETEADHLMKEMDVDKDGSLTLAEMSNRLNTVLGTVHDVQEKSHDEL